jgi:hypothetical protein
MPSGITANVTFSYEVAAPLTTIVGFSLSQSTFAPASLSYDPIPNTTFPGPWVKCPLQYPANLTLYNPIRGVQPAFNPHTRTPPALQTGEPGFSPISFHQPRVTRPPPSSQFHDRERSPPLPSKGLKRCVQNAGTKQSAERGDSSESCSCSRHQTLRRPRRAAA